MYYDKFQHYLVYSERCQQKLIIHQPKILSKPNSFPNHLEICIKICSRISLHPIQIARMASCTIQGIRWVHYVNSYKKLVQIWVTIRHLDWFKSHSIGDFFFHKLIEITCNYLVKMSRWTCGFEKEVRLGKGYCFWWVNCWRCARRLEYYGLVFCPAYSLLLPLLVVECCEGNNLHRYCKN